MFLIVPYYLILKYKTIYFNKIFMTRRVHVHKSLILAVRCDLYNASCLPHRIYFNQTILWAL